VECRGQRRVPPRCRPAEEADRSLSGSGGWRRQGGRGERKHRGLPSARGRVSSSVRVESATHGIFDRIRVIYRNSLIVRGEVIMFLKWSLYNSTGRPVSASPPQRPSLLLFCLPSCSATYAPARWSLVWCCCRSPLIPHRGAAHPQSLAASRNPNTIVVHCQC
jgi:hypothetical protein